MLIEFNQLKSIAMTINSLILESTRRCNMRCDHCLRGPAMKMDMPDDVLQAALNMCKFNNIVITGGEPSLRPDFPARIVSGLRSSTIGYFYVVTNGKGRPDMMREFGAGLGMLYEMCDEKDMCRIECSNDTFHEFYGGNVPAGFRSICNGFMHRTDIDPLNLHQIDRHSEMAVAGTKFQKINGYLAGRLDSFEYVETFNGGRQLFNMGRYGGGGQECTVYNVPIEKFNGMEYYDGDIYVAADGRLYAECDLSYTMMEDERLIVSDDVRRIRNIRSTIRRYNRRTFGKDFHAIKITEGNIENVRST